ncbi:MAG: glycoside hydrolase family 2 TIM barrel-domain containing protein, partial [Planctomycetota bacterium]
TGFPAYIEKRPGKKTESNRAMKINGILLSTMSLMSSVLSAYTQGQEGPVKVELKYEDGKYQLYREGQPYYIKGAGLEFGNLESLARNGGNSFRTWRTENGKRGARKILDEAHELGLTVTMGLEIGRERHGFDYNDPDRVEKQLEYVKAEVLKYKDHPALLAWGIGNELNLRAENQKVWDAVNEISKMIHEIDGNHPTTTMLAGIGRNEIDYIKVNCRDIDFISIQLYGKVINLAQLIKAAGWEGPYIVSEWGATGHWEVAQTEWSIAIEQSSSEKSKSIIERWEKAIYSNHTHCLGSYIFLWGQKQERTPTWYGFFLESGEETELVGTMHYLWNGEWPENRAPSIDSVTLNGKTAFDNIHLKPLNKFTVRLRAENYGSGQLKVRAEIVQDVPEYYGDGGDFEKKADPYYQMEAMDLVNKLSFTAPVKTGSYRVFIYVLDEHNQVATANIPFYVD